MKRGRSLSFLVGTISNVLFMEIGWTDVGSGGVYLMRGERGGISNAWGAGGISNAGGAGGYI